MQRSLALIIAVGLSVTSACAGDPARTPAATVPEAPSAGGVPEVPIGGPSAEAERSASGLAWIVLRPGEGEPARAQDRVVAHYTGWLPDGTKFDSSHDRDQPATFPVRAVIPGWQEALQTMRAGEKRRVWIPAALAYGEVARPGVPTGPLTFDIELLEILREPEPVPDPPAPPDVSAPPDDATITASGLGYKVIRPGTGTRHPTDESTVTVHYTGWTSDGRMFDSSLRRGKPFTARLEHLIAGWQEGVQRMVEGEVARLWIPAALAYGDQSSGNRPAGMLVFDIQLISFEP